MLQSVICSYHSHVQLCSLHIYPSQFQKPQLHLHPKFTTHVETIVSGGSFATFSMNHMLKSMAEIFKVQKKHRRMTCYLHRSPLLVNCLMEQSEMMSLQIKVWKGLIFFLEYDGKLNLYCFKAQFSFFKFQVKTNMTLLISDCQTVFCYSLFYFKRLVMLAFCGNFRSNLTNWGVL